jgi:hypothetical protein
MSSSLLTLQNSYALLYYFIGLFYAPRLLNGSLFDLSIPFFASIAYFVGDSLVHLYMDSKNGKLSYLVYFHHSVPLILLSQVDASQSLDQRIFGVLLLTEVSSVFLVLKYFAQKFEMSTFANNLCRNLFGLSFLGVRGCVCTSILVLTLQTYWNHVDNLKFTVVGTCLGLITVLNTYWSMLIVMKFFNKSTMKVE